MTRADLAYAVDFVDTEAIAGAVKLARELDVDGVMTMQSDIGDPTVGAVVDALGLPRVGETGGGAAATRSQRADGSRKREYGNRTFAWCEPWARRRLQLMSWVFPWR